MVNVTADLHAMGDQQRQRWALVVTGAAGMALPIAMSVYWWRLRGDVASTRGKRPRGSRCRAGEPGRFSTHQQQQQQDRLPQQQRPAVDQSVAADAAIATPSRVPRQDSLAASLTASSTGQGSLRLRLPSDADGGTAMTDRDCFEAAVVQALLDDERQRWQRQSDARSSRGAAACGGAHERRWLGRGTGASLLHCLLGVCKTTILAGLKCSAELVCQTRRPSNALCRLSHSIWHGTSSGAVPAPMGQAPQLHSPHQVGPLAMSQL